MKIQPTDYMPAIPPAKPKGVEAKAHKKGGGEDQVQLSDAARALSQGGDDDGVDLQKVARIRQQLEAGTYKIDDTAVAHAMLQRELSWFPK